ncbi:MAG: hypothetical protein HY738_22565 [Bacteroidia bacterium]|nr:hypothetical protein [Bacteroidia bacterium]
MIKYLIILLNIISILAYYLISGNDVVISPKVPEEVRAGNDFIIEINIKKGNLNQYARFIQELPPGFTASPINTQGATFTFAENNVKFTWISLPEQKEFTISYKVHVDNSIYGNFAISGQFAYVDQDFERKAVAYSEWTTILVLNDNYKDKIFEAQKSSEAIANSPDEVKCTRKRKVSGNEIIVELEVVKNLSKYVKIYEIIPSGYNATAIESKEGVFSYVNQTAKFMWQNCPEGGFNVSYKLTPESGVLNKVPEIKGTYYYMDINRKTQSVLIIDKSNQSELQLSAGTQLTGSETIAPTTTTTTTESSSGQQKTSGTNGTSSDESSDRTGGKKSDGTISDYSTSSDNSGKSTKKSTKSSATSGKIPKIEYHVQICALKILNRSPSYFNTNKNFLIPGKIVYERHNGWNKFTIGKFTKYIEAQKFRDDLLQTTNAPQAFITAYNKSRRITVQEAIMIQSENNLASKN